MLEDPTVPPTFRLFKPAISSTFYDVQLQYFCTSKKGDVKIADLNGLNGRRSVAATF